MSSGFVSGGQDSDWVKAQQEIEERTRVKNAEGKQHDGKSLYEVLEANKAAKQEAFEESAKLKNQFRALDDDEVDFLESVLESTRAKEAAVKKETAEQLEAFRKQREAAETARFDDADHTPNLDSARPLPSEDSWTTRKKRRREKVAEPILGAKVRRLSSKDDSSPLRPIEAPQEGENDSASAAAQPGAQKKADGTVPKQAPSAPTLLSNAETKVASSSLLGLGDYSSDED